MKNYVSYVHILVLGARHSVDVGELQNLFNGGEYGYYQVSMIVDHLLDDVFALEELMGHQLTVVGVEVSQHIRDGVVDRIGHAVADICEVRFLGCGNNLLH